MGELSILQSQLATSADVYRLLERAKGSALFLKAVCRAYTYFAIYQPSPVVPEVSSVSAVMEKDAIMVYTVVG